MTRGSAPSAADGPSAPVDAGTIHLDGELTIYRAQELQQVLRTTLEAAADGAALRVDLSAVSEIDSAGVQVLIAARHSATAGGRSLQVEGVSPAVQEVVDLMGLAALLGLRQSAAGQP